MLVARPALAQQTQPTGQGQRDELSAGLQALLNVDLRIGPFFVRPEIGLNGGLRSVAAARKDDGGLATDLVATPHGQVELVLPFRNRHELNVRGRLHYDWYQDFESLRSFTTTLSGNYSYTGPRIQLTVGDTFVDGQQGTFNPINVEGVTVDRQLDVDETLLFRTNHLVANSELRVRPGWFLRFSGRREFVRYDAGQTSAGIEIASRLNRERWGTGAALAVDVTPRMTWAVLYDYDVSDFDDPENIRNHNTDRLAGKIELRPNTRFRADVLAGVRRIRLDRADLDSPTGAVVEALLEMVPGGRATIETVVQRDFMLSVWDNNTHFVRFGGRTSLLFAVARPIRIGGEFGYFEHDYPEPALVQSGDGAFESVQRVDELFSYAGRLEWDMGRGGQIRTRVGWFERRSAVDFFNLDGLTVQVGYAVAY